MQDCKDGSGLQFMKFDLLTGGQDDFFQFQDNKASLTQAPGHNHENTIFQPDSVALKRHGFLFYFVKYNY